jgi:hypothetical protein
MANNGWPAADEIFRVFLFAAIPTGLRLSCELVRLTTDDVVEIAFDHPACLCMV